MKRIYDCRRSPVKRNCTVANLKALAGSGCTLSMADVRRIAPTHFTGAGSTWAQFGSDDEIVAYA